MQSSSQHVLIPVFIFSNTELAAGCGKKQGSSGAVTVTTANSLFNSTLLFTRSLFIATIS